MCIWTKDEYAEFIRKPSKPKVKRKIFLRLANTKEDEKEEDSWTKGLSSNSEVFISFIFGFFYNSL